jgi:hypothetical protein
MFLLVVIPAVHLGRRKAGIVGASLASLIFALLPPLGGPAVNDPTD